MDRLPVPFRLLETRSAKGGTSVELWTSVYSVAGVIGPLTAATGVPAAISRDVWAENWLGSNAPMITPLGFSSSAASRLVCWSWVLTVRPAFQVSGTPIFFASLVPPHIRVTQYG